MKNNYVVFPLGGLCNRLQVIFSYYSYCKKKNIDLIVVWQKNQESPFDFEDYFIAPTNCTIIDFKNYTDRVDYKGYHPSKQVNYNKLTYINLLFNNKTSEIINQYLNQIQNYNAIHIRRTDHTEFTLHRKIQQTHYDQYDDFVIRSEKKVYLATDNKETQQCYKNKFPDKIFFYQEIKDTETLRKTSVLHAIVDLYACISAEEFYGAHQSSFTGFIKIMRDKKSPPVKQVGFFI